MHCKFFYFQFSTFPCQYKYPFCTGVLSGGHLDQNVLSGRTHQKFWIKIHHCSKNSIWTNSSNKNTTSSYCRLSRDEASKHRSHKSVHKNKNTLLFSLFCYTFATLNTSCLLTCQPFLLTSSGNDFWISLKSAPFLSKTLLCVFSLLCQFLIHLHCLFHNWMFVWQISCGDVRRKISECGIELHIATCLLTTRSHTTCLLFVACLTRIQHFSFILLCLRSGFWYHNFVIPNNTQWIHLQFQDGTLEIGQQLHQISPHDIAIMHSLLKNNDFNRINKNWKFLGADFPYHTCSAVDFCKPNMHHQLRQL